MENEKGGGVWLLVVLAAIVVGLLAAIFFGPEAGVNK